MFLDKDDPADLSLIGKLYNMAKTHDADIACCGFNGINKLGHCIRKYTDKHDFTDVHICGPDVVLMMLGEWICTGSAIYRGTC